MSSKPAKEFEINEMPFHAPVEYGELKKETHFFWVRIPSALLKEMPALDDLLPFNQDPNRPVEPPFFPSEPWSSGEGTVEHRFDLEDRQEIIRRFVEAGWKLRTQLSAH